MAHNGNLMARNGNIMARNGNLMAHNGYLMAHDVNLMAHIGNLMACNGNAWLSLENWCDNRIRKVLIICHPQIYMQQTMVFECEKKVNINWTKVN